MRNELDVLLDRDKRTYGLIFESHLPERVRLPERPLRVGTKVAYRDNPRSPDFEVLAINGEIATLRKVRNPEGSFLSPEQAGEVADERVEQSALVVIADCGETVYPGLRALGSIDRGGDKPAHIVIKGENYHVLDALRFTHAGKVDCIYIDPPYNSGARDWKYDNHPVDDSDAHRHSKWLAFMERRLRLAKQLLRPEKSVLIVTIDEKEYLRLGLLLEQMFAGHTVQMVSTLINPASVARAGAFGRSDEYIFFVTLGTAAPQQVRLSREWVSAKGRTHTGNIRWDLLRRSGGSAARKDSPGCFYPIYVNPSGPTIAAVGDALPKGKSVPQPLNGCVAVLPIRQDKTEGRWQWTPATLRTRMAQGRVRITGSEQSGFVVSILKDGEFGKIERGEFQVIDRNPDGSLVCDDVGTDTVLAVPGSQWHIGSHDATQYGSRMLTDALLPGRKFPFPKSLYAVEDTLRFFVQDNPDAVVLDFFAGSGTTAHAVARLNEQYGGRRQAILVTNNEVSAEEAAALRARGLRPGDRDWEALGIFEHITRPRMTAAITGVTPEGAPIKGDYRFTDLFPMSDGFAENVGFYELVYLDAESIEIDDEFNGVAALLWLRAGGIGPVIEAVPDAAGQRQPYAWTNSYGVLFNPDRWRGFVDSRPATAATVFIVTDSQTIFAGIAAELPARVRTVRLYENYLATFGDSRGYL